MLIHGLVVSVDYAEQLAKGLPLWLNGLDSLTVVTAPRDTATIALAQQYGLSPFITDLFYRDGAHFNKGRAMAAARQQVPWTDWVLLFDADVTPPADWKQQLEDQNLEPGYLYGTWRYNEAGRRLPDDSHAYGWFQLFHSSDPLANQPGLLQECWTHAGNYDSFLMLRWRDAHRLAPVLPLRLVHPDNPNHNWFGIGEEERFKTMERERRRRGGGWKSIEGERLQIG